MSDSDSTKTPPVAAAESTPPTTPSTPDAATATDQQQAPKLPSDDIMDQARRFLATDHVKGSTKEKKAEFLKLKGLSDDNITRLLAEPSESQEDKQQALTPPLASSFPAATLQPPSIPPIVTYPEFLATASKPPPLITIPGLVNALYAVTTAGLAVYGTSKFVVNPMVQSLAEARSSLASSADSKLGELVEKLEGVVSVVPPAGSASTTLKKRSKKNRKGNKSRVSGPGDGSRSGSDDDGSDSGSDETESLASDPTELFHRDIGTQTSASLAASSSSVLLASSATPPLPQTASETQADRLAKLNASLRAMSDSMQKQGEGAKGVMAVSELLREDLNKLTYSGPGDHGYSGIYGGSFGGTSGAGADGEVKKVKDEIRRIKGTLLSSRSFPAIGGTAW